ncbi:protein of unknown function [Pseudomonas mediterranea]
MADRLGGASHPSGDKSPRHNGTNRPPAHSLSPYSKLLCEQPNDNSSYSKSSVLLDFAPSFYSPSRMLDAVVASSMHAAHGTVHGHGPECLR